MNKSTSQILQEARALVAQGWCQGPYIREEFGQNCYCAMGAVYAAAGEDPYGLDHPPLLGLLEDQLDAAAQQITGNPNINAVGYNEHLGRTREEVLALFDRALVEVTK